jgi:hypothetical protein
MLVEVPRLWTKRRRRICAPPPPPPFGFSAGIQGAELPSITPKVFSSLVAWWRSDMGVTTSSGNITSWADQSGNGWTATASGTAEPAFNATDANFNGWPSFTFNGSTNVLTTSSMLALNLTNPTMVAIFKFASLTASSQQIIMGTASRPQFGANVSGSQYYIYAGAVKETGVAPSTSGIHAAGAVLDTVSGNTMNLYLDSSTAAYSTTNSTNGSVVGQLSIGGVPGVVFLNGTLAEAMIFSAKFTSTLFHQLYAFYLGPRYAQTWS